MKKIVKIFLTALLLCVVAHGAAPSRVAVDGAYDWELYDTISLAGNKYDSLQTTTDSTSNLVARWRPEKGWEYILVRDTISGPGSDSIAIAWRVRAKDYNDSLLYTVTFDSSTAIAGEAMVIPVGQTCIGDQYEIIGATYTGHSVSGWVRLNGLYIYRRRPTNVQQTWQVRR